MFASGQEHTLMANQYLMLWTSKSKLLLIRLINTNKFDWVERNKQYV